MTGLASCLVLAVALGVIVWLIATDRKPRA